MASHLIFNTPSLTLFSPAHASVKPPSLFPASPALQFSGAGDFSRREKRGLTVIRRGAPSSGSYIFAFVFPLSLLVATIFTSIKIADKLERDFLEDLEVYEAIRQAEEEDGDNVVIVQKEPEPALPRIRNRPKREA